jgi:fructose-bisphosphate aldolase, class II
VIHVNTELRVAWRRGLEDALRQTGAVSPYKVLPGVLQSVKGVVDQRLQLFNEANFARGSLQKKA